MTKETLNPKQEKFCQLYASDQEFFGNGVGSYTEVYKPDRSKPNWYKAACSSAARLLANAKVMGRINDLLESGGLNDAFVDKQMLFLVSQHADFTNKMAAIREYNKLKARITDKAEKVVTHKFEEMTDEDLDRAIKARQDRLS